MARECTCDDASRLGVDEVAQALRTDCKTGLGAADVAQRLARGGPNALRSVPPTPAWRRLLAQFHDPLTYLLLGAIVVTLVVWEIEGQAGWPFDAIAIAVIVVLNAILGFVQEARAHVHAVIIAAAHGGTIGGKMFGAGHYGAGIAESFSLESFYPCFRDQ